MPFGMGLITMWRRGVRKCLLVVSGEQVTLRLVEGKSIVREEAIAPRFAARLAENWKIEELCVAWDKQFAS